MRTILVAVVASLALAGCALSPQTIHVAPTMSIATDSIGRGHTVNLQIVDERSDTTLGSRGGVYAKSSVINADNDVLAAVRAELEKGLTAQGYAFGSTNADIVLHVTLQQIAYVVPQGAMATGADITAAVRIAAERNGSTHTADYRSTVTRKFPVAPTATQNEIWINEVLGETLSRFFSDQAMRAFVTSP